MERAFSKMGNRTRTRRRFHRLREMLLAGITAFIIDVGVVPARAQEQVLFPTVHNAQQAILDRIRSEQVRLGVAVWFLGDGEISQAIDAKAPSPLPTGCSAGSPGPGWTCVGTVWQPTGFPSAPCGALPDPFAVIGGGVCVNGGWVPRDHPLAGGGSERGWRTVDTDEWRDRSVATERRVDMRSPEACANGC